VFSVILGPVLRSEADASGTGAVCLTSFAPVTCSVVFEVEAFAPML
jgi:hypothetical protein